MLLLPLYYIRWHYTQALVDLVRIVLNFVWFFNEFFSIRLLLSTLFTPFHRLEDDAKTRGGIDIATIAERILVSLLMRIVGALMRSMLIVMGIVCVALSIVGGIALLLVWICAPALLAICILAGITYVAI